MILLWVRKSAYDQGLDPKLEEAVKGFIKDQWPLEKVTYPGRDITWDEFNKLG